MVVYLITNIINNRKYVGLTKRNIKVRWYEHVKKSKDINIKDFSLHKDIFIYGKDNFTIETLIECNSSSEMCLYEKRFIEEFDTVNNGYNMNSGGKVYDMSTKLRNHMSDNSPTSRIVNVYNLSGDYISKYESVNKACRVLNIDTRKAFRVLSGKRKSCGGYIFSYMFFDKIEIVNNRIVPVYKYDSDCNLIGEYRSIDICASESMVNRCYIERVLSGKRKHHKGFYYFHKKVDRFITKKKLYQYDIDDNLINIFISIKIASDILKINRTTISKIISGERNNRGFYFIWK